MTLRPKGIGNFKDFMAQWYRKFQIPSYPKVSEISKDLMAKCYLAIRSFEISDTFALGHKVFEISNTIGP